MTPRWRILQVLDKAPDEGGVAVHVAELGEGLRRHGHDVIELRIGVAAGHGTPGQDTLPITYGAVSGQRQKTRLAAILARTRPHLIHLQGCFTTLSSSLIHEMSRHGAVIGTFHDIRPFCYLMTRRLAGDGELCGHRCGIACFGTGCMRAQGPLDVLRLGRRWLVDRQALATWAKLDRLIVPSAYMRDLAMMHGVAPARLRVIPHGATSPVGTTFDTTGARPPTLLYVGSLLAYKGVSQLLQALRLLGDRPWNAIFVGEGPMRGQLQADLERFGLSERVRMPGHIKDRPTLASLIARARLLVIPSIIPESFSLAGVEALAAGTPVVSFGLGGQHEWLRDGENGLIARDRDVADLAAKIARLLDAPELALKLGRNGRELVARRFQPSQSLEAHLEVYRDALATLGGSAKRPDLASSSAS